MTKLFIPSTLSFVNIKEFIEHIETLDIAVESTAIGNSFDEFTQTLNNGDRIIVQSLDFFPSLIELLATIAKLEEQNIKIKSIEEPWLNDKIESTAQFLDKLHSLAVKMHARRTNIGLLKARNLGKQLGRRKGQTYKTKLTPEKLSQIERLRIEEHLTIAKACLRIGCSVSTYNIAKRKQQNSK